MQKFLELREVHFQEVEHVKLLVTFFKKPIGHVPTTNFVARPGFRATADDTICHDMVGLIGRPTLRR